MQVIDNLLPNLFFNKLKNIFGKKNQFNWFWNNTTAGGKDGNLDNHFMFTHMLWNVDTGSGDGKKLEKMIYNNRFKGQDSGKEIADLMDDVFKQAIKHDKKKQ